MNKPKLVLAAAFALLSAVTHAQEKTPMIRGTVEISVKKGTIAGDLIVTDLPDIKNYVIRLNSGLNIHYFKDLKRSTKDALYYDTDTKDSIRSDETKAYYLHENTGNPARYIPEELEVKYLGMYPVIKDSTSGYMGQDWRGNVAFNGYSMRAEGLQGDWYPVLYDKDKRRLYHQVRYDITVTCKDCSVLFVNGSKPVRGTTGTFKSDVPYEMSIFCGDYKATEKKGVWLLNDMMTKDDQQKFFAMVGSYQAYYEKLFGIPYNGSLSFAQTTPVADPENWAFSFFTAPTTINVGIGKYGMQTLFDGTDPRKKQVVAHELAHYYFGTLVKHGDEFGSVMSEGFAEYLSFKLTRTLESREAFQTLLNNKWKALKYLRNYKPFAQVRAEDDYGNREYYLYYYSTVLFFAIEKEIGEQTMDRWLNAMVAAHAERPGYKFFLDTFSATVTDKALRDKVIAKYFTSDKAMENAGEELGLK